jgi:hypothetical protein
MGICIVLQRDQRVHTKIFLLQTWMQMMTVSASLAAWQSITPLILYASQLNIDITWLLVKFHLQLNLGILPQLHKNDSVALHCDTVT